MRRQFCISTCWHCWASRLRHPVDGPGQMDDVGHLWRPCVALRSWTLKIVEGPNCPRAHAERPVDPNAVARQEAMNRGAAWRRSWSACARLQAGARHRALVVAQPCERDATALVVVLAGGRTPRLEAGSTELDQLFAFMLTVHDGFSSRVSHGHDPSGTRSAPAAFETNSRDVSGL